MFLSFFVGSVLTVLPDSPSLAAVFRKVYSIQAWHQRESGAVIVRFPQETLERSKPHA